MTSEQLADRVSAAVWNLHPEWAVAAGQHTYDGQVPDLSAVAIEAGLERLARLRGQLTRDGPAPGQEADVAVLLAAVDRERFDGEVVRRWQRDPSWYLGCLDVSAYLEGDYASAGLRLERAAGVLEEAGSVLGDARRNLAPAIPRALVEGGAARARTLAERVVRQAEWAAGAPAAAAEAAWLRAAASSAGAELEAYAVWLEEERLPAAGDDFALGPGGLEEWLRAGEAVDWTAREIVAAAGKLLEADRAALAVAPATSPAARAGTEMLAELEGAVEEARCFAREQGWPLAGSERLRVAEGCGEPGEAAGRLWLPGPRDDPAAVPILYLVTGRESPSRGSLEDLAVGAWAACLLQRPSGSRVPGEARRRFPSPAFREGWAGLARDLMAEAGYGRDRPGWRRVAASRAVLEDCRLVCVAGLHAAGMSLGEAGAVFGEEAGLAEASARAEALRCAADPGRAAAGLGRAILREVRARRGGPPGMPGAPFLEAVVSAGAVPVGLLDRLLP